jgi:hypothetical protein
VVRSTPSQSLGRRNLTPRSYLMALQKLLPYLICSRETEPRTYYPCWPVEWFLLRHALFISSPCNSSPKRAPLMLHFTSEAVLNLVHLTGRTRCLASRGLCGVCCCCCSCLPIPGFFTLFWLRECAVCMC